MKNIIEITAALLAPITAIFLAWVSFRQYQIQKNQFKFDLYNRRLQVFKALTELLGAVLRDGNVDTQKLNSFIVGSSEDEFLFDKEVSQLIDTIRTKAIHLQFVIGRLSDQSLGVCSERTKLAEEHFALLGWFTDQFEISKKIFKKYLAFTK
jgi:hypothetical protein